jgi:hypothetical protein
MEQAGDALLSDNQGADDRGIHDTEGTVFFFGTVCMWACGCTTSSSFGSLVIACLP